MDNKGINMSRINMFILIKNAFSSVPNFGTIVYRETWLKERGHFTISHLFPRLYFLFHLPIVWIIVNQFVLGKRVKNTGFCFSVVLLVDLDSSLELAEITEFATTDFTKFMPVIFFYFKILIDSVLYAPVLEFVLRGILSDNKILEIWE